MSKKEKPAKTNAVRLLDQENIPYELTTYSKEDGKIDGVSVAQKIGIPPANVFKTLVAMNGKGAYFVYLLPVADELDLKKAAQAADEKKVELLPVKELVKITGYERGGCSPYAMKKLFPTFVDEKVKELDFLVVSAGKIGLQLKLTVEDFLTSSNARVHSLTHS
ncbi:Cys-tRNA(Pro) deacylase [Paenisporosarcina cavernae]|uniref:Cys-tRNA(Pro)/Cys-tRNA(Cys) deacylase n=1 Tax=Paenisporosarcina cavernae TaxID=2320858 RepID=A0A385YRX7_9BACL|nr:Cys-tRNA(Pro) deacylase [Paenisporosarcina cavernae]AYC28757.1 Cys-tRNA(Pro) deacylase [Paenisporosarcina cavernae]